MHDVLYLHQEQRGDEKTNALLGMNPGKTKEAYNVGVFVCGKLEEFDMSALKSSPTLRWENCEKAEKEMLASPTACWTTFVDSTELTCAVR